MQCELQNNVTNVSTVFHLWKREGVIKRRAQMENVI